MKFRVLHFPQIPCEPFITTADTIEEAKKIIDMLANYDLFQYENKIKADYTNMTTLEYWDEEEKEWLNWSDEDGHEIDDYELIDGRISLVE